MSISVILSHSIISAIDIFTMDDTNENTIGFAPLVLLSEVNICSSSSHNLILSYNKSSIWNWVNHDEVFDEFQVVGITAVILMSYWMGDLRGGFAWQDNPKYEFNWHPLLMTIGLIFLYGNGMNDYLKNLNTFEVEKE